MTRRVIAVTSVLCSAVLAAACSGSPEVGIVDHNSPTISPTTTTSPTTPPTPPLSGEEKAAANAARARYVTARAAVTKAMQDPPHATSRTLEDAGNGSSWLASVISDVMYYEDNGWYQAGAVKILTLKVVSVNLNLEQPEVRLATCIDSSGTKRIDRATRKAVPVHSVNGFRHQFNSRLVYAPSARSARIKIWWLVDEKRVRGC